MPKKLFTIGLILMIAVWMAGCAANPESPAAVTTNPGVAADSPLTTAPDGTTGADTTTGPDGTEPDGTGEESCGTGVYRPILDRFHELITTENEGELGEGEIGVYEIRAYESPETVLELIGYAVRDVSGDGIPELLIGAISEREGPTARGNEIYALYTCVDGEPYFVFEGWSRSINRSMGGGDFYAEASSGAAYSVFGDFTITGDGREIKWNNFYFTEPKDGPSGDLGYYYNTTGEWNTAISEELDFTEDRFVSIWDGYEARIQSLELTPFSEYEPSGAASAPSEKPAVSVWFADEVDRPGDYDEFTAESGESSVRVLFRAEKAVRDFKVLAISFDRIDADDMIFFETEELYRLERLTPDGRPFVVEMVFYGLFPNNGISYVDEDGATRYYSLYLSGRDGSLQLSKFEPAK